MDFDSKIIQAESHPTEKEKVETGSSAVQEIINLVPEKDRDKVMSALTVIRQESFAGPIPPPQVLQGYESILPGSADRILAMAESQQKHRFNMEDKAISGQVANAKRGQIFAFIVFLVCTGIGLAFAFLGMKVFAGVFLSVSMVIVVSLFIGGRMRVRADLETKSKDQTK